MSRLDRHVAAVRNKLAFQRFLQSLAWTALVLSSVIWLVVLVDRLLGVILPHKNVAFYVGVGSAVVAAIAYSLFHRPSAHDAAVAIDERLSLKEKFSTALYVRSMKDPFAAAAVRDAEKTADNVSLNKQFPLKFPKIANWTFVAMAAAFCTAYFLKPQDLFGHQAAEQKKALELAQVTQTKKAVQDAITKVETIAKTFPTDNSVVMAKKELQNLLAQPITDTAKTQRSAAEALSNLDKQIKQQIAQSKSMAQAQNDQKMLANMQSPTDEKGPVADAHRDIAKGDFDKAVKDIQQAVDKFDKMDDEEKKKAAQQMAKLAEQLQKAANDPAQQKKMQDQLQQAGATQQQAQQIQQMMQQAAAGDKNAQQQLQKMAQQMQQQMSPQQQQAMQQAMKQMQAQANGQMQAQQMGAAAQQMAQAMQQAAQGQQPGQQPGQQGQQSQQAKSGSQQQPGQGQQSPQSGNNQQQMANAAQQMQQQMQQMQAIANDAQQQAAAASAADSAAQDAADQANGDQSNGDGKGGQGQANGQGKQGQGKRPNPNAGKGQWAQGNPAGKKGGGFGGPGQGNGGGPGVEEAPYDVKQEVAPVQNDDKGKFLATTFVKAGSIRGDSKAELQKAVQAADRDATDDVDSEAISGDAKRAVKGYFGQLSGEAAK